MQGRACTMPAVCFMTPLLLPPPRPPAGGPPVSLAVQHAANIARQRMHDCRLVFLCSCDPGELGPRLLWHTPPLLSCACSLASTHCPFPPALPCYRHGAAGGGQAHHPVWRRARAAGSAAAAPRAAAAAAGGMGSAAPAAAAAAAAAARATCDAAAPEAATPSPAGGRGVRQRAAVALSS